MCIALRRKNIKLIRESRNAQRRNATESEEKKREKTECTRSAKKNIIKITVRNKADYLIKSDGPPSTDRGQQRNQVKKCKSSVREMTSEREKEAKRERVRSSCNQIKH